MHPRLTLALILAALSLARPARATGEDFNCTEHACAAIECPNTKACSDSQLKVLSPRHPCGCCFGCIDFLGEGDICEKTISVYRDLPSTLCGPNLVCEQSDDPDFTTVCRKMRDNTACEAAQAAYDADKALIPGRLRPDCDAEGRYEGRQRLPGLTTSCYSQEGGRIYGERGSTQDGEMACACARLHAERASLAGLGRRPHCLTDGNFDTLQCNNITCFCVDEKSGVVTSVTAAFDFMDLLDCFNSTIHNKDYLKPCEKAAKQLSDEALEFENEGFSLAGIPPPKCDAGGYFDKVQDSRTERYCVAPDGTPLDYTAPRTSAAAQVMTCNCARSAYHMRAAGQMTDLPQCCSNGDFRPFQCRGLYCYCVDGDGQQTDIPAQPQISQDQLPCYNTKCPDEAP